MIDMPELGWNALPPDIDPAAYRRAWLGPGEAGDGVSHLTYADAYGITDKTRCRAEDSSIHEMTVVHTLERVTDVVAFWKELYRVCSHGACVRVVGTYWSHVDVQADPSRLRGVSERMFAYLAPGSRTSLLADPYEDDVGISLLTGVDFDTTSFQHLAEPEWHGHSDDARYWAARHHHNVVRRLITTLQCHKPVRVLP